jgi:hypothetical protein
VVLITSPLPTGWGLEQVFSGKSQFFKFPDDFQKINPARLPGPVHYKVDNRNCRDYLIGAGGAIYLFDFGRITCHQSPGILVLSVPAVAWARLPEQHYFY